MLDWLVGVVIKDGLSWLASFLAGIWQRFQRDKTNHAEAVAQAAQDNAKAQTINEASKADDVDAAIDDSLKHI